MHRPTLIVFAPRNVKIVLAPLLNTTELRQLGLHDGGARSLVTRVSVAI